MSSPNLQGAAPVPAQMVGAFPGLPVDEDMVLRAQGADPAVIRARRPRLLELAALAVKEGQRLILPVAVWRTMAVEKRTHDTLTLAGNIKLKSSLLAENLACAEQVALMVCSLGGELEKRVSVLMQVDPTYAFALDAYGSAAAEALGIAVCASLEAQAAQDGLFTSIPLSPGMLGWPVEIGQPQIFSALDVTPIGLCLNDSYQMVPHKSTSMVLGISSSSFSAGRPCDFCSLQETCRYQNKDQSFGGAGNIGL